MTLAEIIMHIDVSMDCLSVRWLPSADCLPGIYR